LISGGDQRTGVEMEMRLRDAQALERRIELKRRDDPVESLVVLVADTRGNRRVLSEHSGLFRGLARVSFGTISRLLHDGYHPPSSLVLL